MSVTVLGAGTWGTAITILLANKGKDVILWSKIENEIKTLEADRSYIKNLPGAVLPESVKLTCDHEYACKTSEPELIVFAVASPFVRSTAHLVSPYIKEGQRIVNEAKGIEEATLYTLLDILNEEIPQANNSVLSGPSHAEEVSRLIPTTVVVASHDRATAEFLQDMFMTDTLSDNSVVYYTQHIDYRLSVGYVEIQLTNSDYLYPTDEKGKLIPPYEMSFRLQLIY